MKRTLLTFLLVTAAMLGGFFSAGQLDAQVTYSPARGETLKGTVDPSAGAGVAAAEGTLYVRTGATDQLWQKTGATATSWTNIAGGAASFSSLTVSGNITSTAGNIAATAGDLTAGDDIVAADAITATAGNITASAGNLVATIGDVSVGDDVLASDDATITDAITASNGRVTGAGFTSSVNGTTATPAYNYTGATNYGHALISSVLTSVINGNSPFYVSSAHATTDSGITMQVGGRLQAYTIYSADVTGTVNNLDPGNATILHLNPTAARSVTGMVFVGTGDIRFIKNVAAAGSGFNLTLEHEDAGSSANNRWRGAGGADVVIPPQGLAIATTNGTTVRWEAFLVQ